MGGTVGLAQCFIILNAKVISYITSQIPYLVETFSPSDLASLTSLINNGGLADRGEECIPEWGQVEFRMLIPWFWIGCIVSVFWGRIVDSDKQGNGKEVGQDGEGSKVEHVEM